MQEDKMIPYAVYEAVVHIHAEIKKRLIVAIIILALGLIGTNVFWLYEWTRYDTVDYSYVQDGKGTNVIGSGNEVLYGTEIGSPSTDEENPN